MPQETKSRPFNADEVEKVGFEHENLEGWIPPLATDEELRVALEKAFDFRGDVTLTLKNGQIVEGYIFDRRTGSTLSDSTVRIIPKNGELEAVLPLRLAVARGRIAAQAAHQGQDIVRKIHPFPLPCERGRRQR